MDKIISYFLDHDKSAFDFYKETRDQVFANFETIFFAIFESKLELGYKMYAINKLGQFERILTLDEKKSSDQYPVSPQLIGLLEFIDDMQYLGGKGIPPKLWHDLLQKGLDLAAKCLKEKRIHLWRTEPDTKAFVDEYTRRVNQLAATGKYYKLIDPLGT